MPANAKRVFYVKYLAAPLFQEILATRPDVTLHKLENDSPAEEVEPVLASAHAYQIGSSRDELAPHFHAGAELLKRVSALPGFGEVKAKIFVALLGKQLGVQPPGWREAAGAYGAEGSHLSVADIVDDESLGKVRSYKQALKAAAKDKTAP